MIAIHDIARQQAPQIEELKRALLGVLGSGWYVLGEQVRAFEAAFARYCGVGHAVGVGNGTDALELALRAVGVVAGDAVVTVANAGGYASTAIRACGARARYVDVDAETQVVDPGAVASALAERPRAVVVTHLYGRLAPVEAIAGLARDAGVALIEDCAQAHGARRGGVYAGAFGDLGCYSFYPTKNLGALGDGGAVISNDGALAGRVRQLRQYGWEAKYHAALAGGRNSRLDEIQAALLAVKLGRLDADNERRRAIARAYAAGIANPAIRAPRRDGSDDVVHLYVLRCARRDALRAHLNAHGIASDVHYPVPDHRQAVDYGDAGAVSLPLTERLAAEILTIPCHPAMDDDEVARVIAACNAFRP
jgi:dTDP-4-amino-4,6-dideoxygalactose transaminase